MSERIEIRAEILKLAHLLGREPATLDYLREVPVDDLRALRESVTEALFSAHSTVLARLAAASRLLPAPLVAAIGERAFGAVLSARVAGILDPERAVEMAGRLPVDFLADVAVEIDPRRASEVIARIPPAQIAQISRELIRRGEFVTMGRFVGHLSPDAITAALSAMDDAALLQVAFVLEAPESLPVVIDLLPAERLEGLLGAASREDLWEEALGLLRHLRADQRRRLTELRALDEPGVLERIVAVAHACQLWPDLLPLVCFLPEPEADRAGRAVAALSLDEQELDRLAAAGSDPQLRPGLERLAGPAGLSERLGLEAVS